jgi:excisionase family DNA binding protein
MIAEAIPVANPKPVAKKRGPKAAARPALNTETLYNRREAALVTNLSRMTLIRAFNSGNLPGYRVGTRVLHSGQQILDWLNSGGKTGWTSKGAAE